MPRGSRVRRGSLAALLAAACIGTSSPAATASPGSSRPHRPALLWKSFPLAQSSAAGGSANRATQAPSLPHGDARDPLIVGLLLAIIFGSGVVMLVGVPTSDRLAAARWRFRRAVSRR